MRVDDPFFGPGIQSLIDRIHEESRNIVNRGRVSDYIPELAGVDISKFGIAICDIEGNSFSAGDCDEKFSIQSISKLFTLAMALELIGDKLWELVGREASGFSFNSIEHLHGESGIPRNPFVNAGALVITDTILRDRDAVSSIEDILCYVRKLARCENIGLDRRIAKSEIRSCSMNFAISHYMKSFERVVHDVDQILKVYSHQCAISMTCAELARAGLILANGGKDPCSDEAILSADNVRQINALMMTCGQYDGSGAFACRVGLPSKSGVGGGILAVVPGKASIAVWSPGLNSYGNSQVGSLALEELSRTMGWSTF